MNPPPTQADQFEGNRAHLRSVAYRMLGSAAEADDASRKPGCASASPSRKRSRHARLADRDRQPRLSGHAESRRAHREDLFTGTLPEPVVTLEGPDDPEHEALIADSVGVALQVVLEMLSPAERLAFVLHDTSGCRLRRSPPSSSARSRPRASWPVARAGASAAPSPTAHHPPTPSSVGSSTRSSPPPVKATSTRYWRYSTPMW